MNEFKDLYECKFELSENEILIRTIAEQYVRDAEAYDRAVCTGPIRRGESMPADHHELGLVNRNAQALMDSIRRNHPQFTRAEILRAVSAVDW